MRFVLTAVLTVSTLPGVFCADAHPGIPKELIDFVTPKDNPTTPEKVALGEKLFNDKRLSADNTVSCATCHDVSLGFATRLPTAKGIRDQVGTRNSPSVLNAMFLQTEFWDGRAPTLEAQAKLPIINSIEMGMKDGPAVTAKLATLTEYNADFQKIFHRAPNYDDAARAMAAFERTLMSGEAPIDHVLTGDMSVLTEQQRRGWSLFNGKGRCMSCHAVNPTYPFFTDNLFHNIGVAAHKANFGDLAFKAVKVVERGNMQEIDELALKTDFSELGRFLVTKSRGDVGAFKTQPLRDIVLTAPYMHDGSMATLWDVMDHYNKGGIQNPFLDGGIQRLGLTESEIDDLVAVMDAFTSKKFAAQSKTELARQHKVASAKRPERDTEAAMGRKGHLGDVAPDPDLKVKDPATIGGRPVKN